MIDSPPDVITTVAFFVPSEEYDLYTLSPEPDSPLVPDQLYEYEPLPPDAEASHVTVSPVSGFEGYAAHEPVRTGSLFPQLVHEPLLLLLLLFVEL